MKRANREAEFDWLEDPFDSKKQQQAEEELRHAKKSSGCIVGVAILVIGLILFASSFLIGYMILLFAGIFLAGVGVGCALCSLLQ